MPKKRRFLLVSGLLLITLIVLFSIELVFAVSSYDSQQTQGNEVKQVITGNSISDFFYKIKQNIFRHHCPRNYTDCDGNLSNRCETRLGTNTNCAFCRNACPSEYVCNSKRMCVYACTDTCSSLGYQCGNVCGFNCGICLNGQTCVNGKCVTQSTCTDTCSSLNYQCGVHTICSVNANCGSCATGYSCSAEGKCISSCTPTTCAAQGKNCETISNGCGGILNCGNCSTGYACSEGVCYSACTNECMSGTTQCSSTGNGYQTCDSYDSDSCLEWSTRLITCEAGYYCEDATGRCTGIFDYCIPDCSGKNCGSNGCGKSCGICTTGQTCQTNGTCIKIPCTCPDDGNACTNDTCVNDICTHNPITNCCTSGSKCNDNNACTIDRCVNNQCTHNPITSCLSYDGCCPAGGGCTSVTDNDCSASCGNNIREGAERCDGSDLGGASCAGVMGTGYTGILKCSSTCQFNTISCVAPCTCPDDGNACTTDRCVNNQCTHTSISNCCISSTQCNDYNPCTVEICSYNECSYSTITNCCTSSTQCPSGYTCQTNGSCIRNISQKEIIRCDNSKINLNSDSSLNIFFVGAGYTSDQIFCKDKCDLTNYSKVLENDIYRFLYGDYQKKEFGLLTIEPFNSNLDKVNIYMLTNPVDCDIQANPYCLYGFVEQVANSCPAYNLNNGYINIVMGYDNPQTIPRATGWNKYAVSPRDSVITFVHEFGHSLGLWDLYSQAYQTNPNVMLNSSSLPNCDNTAGCPKWCKGEALPPFQTVCSNFLTEQECIAGLKLGCIWLEKEDPYFKTRCIRNFDYDENYNIGTECMNGTGCYLGCMGAGYRPIPGDNFALDSFSYIIDSSGKKHGYEPVSEKFIKDVLDCCYPQSCTQYDSNYCAGFSRTYPQHAECGICSYGTCTDRIRNNGETGIDCGGSCDACATGNTYYVATNGNDNNPGTFEWPWATWEYGMHHAHAGDIVYFRGGVYYTTNVNGYGVMIDPRYPGGGYNGAPGNYIRYFNYPGEVPILDGTIISNSVTTDTLQIAGIYTKFLSYVHFKGLTVRNFLQTKNWFLGYGFLDWWESDHLIHENCVAYNIGGEGFSVSEGYHNVSYINCDAYNCEDPLSALVGGYGSGFGQGNELYDNSVATYYGCRAWNCSDQGYAGRPRGYVKWDHCWAMDNSGNGASGDGHGFKTSAADIQMPTPTIQREVVNCISANNAFAGFNTNDNLRPSSRTVWYNNFAYHNGYKSNERTSYAGNGFWIQASTANGISRILKNNLAYDNENYNILAEGAYTHDHNSWDSSPAVTVTAADFVSLDYTQLYAPRKADGSLPDITFGHLAAGSDLIDKGVIILGLSYSGSAPDLGAFEYSGSATCTGSTTQSCTITNGVGSQSRTCNAGVWSSWGACTLVSCNSGYIPSGNTCVIPQPGGTCKDGIQNNGETGVDCGGPCIDCVLQADYYVATNGNDNNPGTITQPWKTWQKAFSTAQAGDLVYFRGGVYPYSGAVGSFGISAYNSGTADNWINFFNYPGEEPILDCSGLVPSGDFQRAISVFSKSYIHFKGLTVRNVHQLPYSGSGTGGDVTYSSGIDTYWSHNIIYENMNVHDVDGPCLTINGCDEIHVINSDAWNCNDHLASHPGQNGVGFQGANNVPDFGENMYNTHIYFEGCRTWNFSDNGFASPVVGYTEFKNCWAFDGGALTGEGCGFKLGLGTLSDLVNPLSKLVVNCISANNGNYGFSPNNNQGNVFNAHYYNNFAYHNGYKHYLLWWNQFFGCGFETCDYTGNTPAPNEMYSNNIAYANEYRDMFEEKPYIHNHNSWDINGIQVSNADFVSLDVSQLYSPRNANGSLPTNITFGHLKAGSDLIDKGVIIPGLSYSGSAPDLGAFEYSGTTTCIAETNTAFCTRLNKNCGSVTANDNCGNSRTVSSCGSCSGTCNNGVCTTCVAETNTAFCTRLNKNCGSVTANDNCGNSRTVSSCGSCSGVNTCGGGGTANVCGCTVSSYTPALNTFCGSRSVTTNCGTSVTMTGTLSCSSPNTCGGGGTANVCGCIAETNTAFCTRLNKNCGSVTANDNCGNSRTVSSCGSCSGTCNNGVCTTIPTTGAIIADHTIVDRFDDIPQCYIDKVKTMFFDYPGESHATAVYYGIYYLGQDYPKYACHNTGSGAPEAYTTAYLRVSWTTWGDLTHSTGWITDENGGYAYGEEDWWTNPTAVARTKAGLSYMNSIGVAPSAFGFGWCSDMDWLTIASSGVDPVYGCHWYGMSDGSPSGNRCWGLDDADNAVSGNSVNLDTYLRVTQEYVDYCKANNIPTKVFFTTGPLNSPASCTDCTDEQEYQGWLKMERIRDYVKAHNQILFDYADILSYNDDGTRATRTWNGHTFPTITTTNLGTGSVGHIGRAGALRLGKGVWWMMARIAGWDGVSTTCS